MKFIIKIIILFVAFCYINSLKFYKDVSKKEESKQVFIQKVESKTNSNKVQVQNKKVNAKLNLQVEKSEKTNMEMEKIKKENDVSNCLV